MKHVSRTCFSVFWVQCKIYKNRVTRLKNILLLQGKGIALLIKGKALELILKVKLNYLVLLD